jgi:hypothetical protein
MPFWRTNTTQKPISYDPINQSQDNNTRLIQYNKGNLPRSKALSGCQGEAASALLEIETHELFPNINFFDIYTKDKDELFLDRDVLPQNIEIDLPLKTNTLCDIGKGIEEAMNALEVMQESFWKCNKAKVDMNLQKLRKCVEYTKLWYMCNYIFKSEYETYEKYKNLTMGHVNYNKTVNAVVESLKLKFNFEGHIMDLRGLKYGQTMTDKRYESHNLYQRTELYYEHRVLRSVVDQMGIDKITQRLKDIYPGNMFKFDIARALEYEDCENLDEIKEKLLPESLQTLKNKMGEYLTSQSAGGKKKYKGRTYKIYIGTRGGRFIKVKGKKIYL